MSVTFGSLIGQSRVAGMLSRLIASDRVPHALLFCGPEGAGKTAAALSVARALQCTGEDRTAGPCERCANCGRTRALGHPDFAVVMPFLKKVGEEDRRKQTEDAIANPFSYAPPETGANISIDAIRDLIKAFTLGSYQGSWRTAVILHAHQMRGEAANAMLKTLEEPPPASILILTAPSPESLLPTIVSRCQFVRVPPVPTSDLAAHLQAEKGMTAENAVFVSELSGGNARLALTIASEEAHQTQDRALRFLTALVEGREAQTFTALEQLAAEKNAVFEVLKSAEVWLRDVLHYRVAGAETIVNRHREADVARLADRMSDRTIQTLAEEIERVRSMNTRNINLLVSLTQLWRNARATVAGSV